MVSTLWRELYDVYIPMKRLYNLIMNTYQKEGECSVKITQNGKPIIKCDGEDMENVLRNTIMELDYWERNKEKNKDLRKE